MGNGEKLFGPQQSFLPGTGSASHFFVNPPPAEPSLPYGLDVDPSAPSSFPGVRLTPTDAANTRLRLHGNLANRDMIVKSVPGPAGPVGAGQPPPVPPELIVMPGRAGRGARSTTRTHSNIPKSEMDAYGAALKGAYDKAGDARDKIAKEEEAVAVRKKSALAGGVQNMDKLSGSMQTRRDAIMKELTGASKEMMESHRRAKNMKVEDYWSSRSTGSKIMAFIGVALSSFVEGISGGKVKSNAIALVNRAIDQDIARQKANISAAHQDAASAKGIVAHYYRQLGDVDRAEQMGRLGIREKVDMRLKELGSELKGSTAKAHASLWRAMNQKAMLTEAMKMRAATAGKTSHTIRSSGGGSKAQGYVMVNGKPVPLSIAKKYADYQKAKKAGGPEVPPDKLLRGVAHGNDMLTQLNSAIASMETHGYGAKRYIPGSIPYRTRQMYLVTLGASLRSARESGVMTDRDFKRYKPILDSMWHSGKETLARAKQLRHDLMRSMAAKLRTYRKWYDVKPLLADLARATKKNDATVGAQKGQGTIILRRPSTRSPFGPNRGGGNRF